MQSLPLGDPTGRYSHCLVLADVPFPHDFVHGEYSLHNPQFPSTGHISVLHAWFSVSFPVQFLPYGAGFLSSILNVQLLFLDWLPPPHVTEHVLQDSQSVHSPSTGQGVVLQSDCSDLDPVQLSPCGTFLGNLHRRL